MSNRESSIRASVWSFSLVCEAMHGCETYNCLCARPRFEGIASAGQQGSESAT